MNAFGARLKEIRESRFTIKQFAQIVKEDVGTLRNYESGNYLPSVKTLIEMIEALQVNHDYLLSPLIETHLDDELNKIIEKINLIYENEEDREAIKMLIKRYKIPERAL